MDINLIKYFVSVAQNLNFSETARQNFVSQSTVSLALEENDEKKCEETIRRTEKLIETYHVTGLNPNAVLLFYRQAALFYAKQGEKNQVRNYLERFTEETAHFFRGNLTMLNDEYFNHLDVWLEKQGAGELPRSSRVILESAASVLCTPQFEAILGKEDLKPMLIKLERIGEKL